LSLYNDIARVECVNDKECIGGQFFLPREEQQHVKTLPSFV